MSASRRTFLACIGAGATGLGWSAGVASPMETGGDLLPLISTYIAGSDRYGAPAIAGQLEEGDRLELRREPENGYDMRAVSVWSSDGRNKLGYVPRNHNQALANLMDAGIAARARVAAVNGQPGRPDISVVVAVALPTSSGRG